MPSHYTDEYIEQAFYVWYNANKCGSLKLIGLLPATETGNRPSRMVAERWIHEHGWIERGDGLDAEVSRGLDNDVIEVRRAMFKKNVEVANELLDKSREYLQTHDLKDSSDAIRGIATSVEILRDNVGKAEAWQKISGMTDAQITKELERLTGRPQKKESEFIDVEAEEVVGEDDTESE